MRLDEDLLDELKARARRDDMSITRVLNRVVRLGLQASDAPQPPRRRFREKPAAMGVLRPASLDKALALASVLEDDETGRELSVGR